MYAVAFVFAKNTKTLCMPTEELRAQDPLLDPQTDLYIYIPITIVMVTTSLTITTNTAFRQKDLAVDLRVRLGDWFRVAGAAARLRPGHRVIMMIILTITLTHNTTTTNHNHNNAACSKGGGSRHSGASRRGSLDGLTSGAPLFRRRWMFTASFARTPFLFSLYPKGTIGANTGVAPGVYKQLTPWETASRAPYHCVEVNFCFGIAGQSFAKKEFPFRGHRPCLGEWVGADWDPPLRDRVEFVMLAHVEYHYFNIQCATEVRTEVRIAIVAYHRAIYRQKVL